jgi:Na+/H+-dicarboxylate symporter
MLRTMPVFLLLVMAVVVMLNPYLPLEVKEVLYAISLTIKSLIIFMLPAIIFTLLLKTMVSMSRSATAVITLILVCVCLSNFTSTFLSHFVGSWIYQFNLSLILPNDVQGLKPAWTLVFPKLIENNKAMFAGIFLGLILGSIKSPVALQIADLLDRWVLKILKSFIYLIPLFIAGFIVKLTSDGTLQTIIKDYTMIFVMIAVAQFSYIFIAYAILNRFNLTKTYQSMKDMLPAAIAGFSTMSSAAVMPLTIAGVSNSAKHKELTRSVIPATVNIHLVGDCFAIPIFAYAVMKSYGMAEPALLQYLVFVMYFVIAKFSVAAIPGGGIVVMLPILESCLGFNTEMLSLMTALYVLFDPVITCANVFGNGAFAKLIDRLVSLRSKLSLQFAGG